MNNPSMTVANLGIDCPSIISTRMTNRIPSLSDAPLPITLSVQKREPGKHTPPQYKRNLLGESWITNHP